MSPAAAGAPTARGRYGVFGEILAADAALPGLPVAPLEGDGRFRVRTLHTTRAPGTPVGHSTGALMAGQLQWPNHVHVSLASGADGDEIAISDTGRYTIADGGATVLHHAPDGCDRAAVALDLIGVVLPLALHREGAWCLHASAVQLGARVIAFVATRGTGKSTLAAACLQHGATLVADDVVVLRVQDGAVHVTPSGLPLRLRERTARDTGAASDGPDEWGKVRVHGPLARDAARLDAVYVLGAAEPSSPVARAPRAARAAALALLAHGKITELLGAAAAGDALTRCAQLAQAVPVYDLAVPRELARLPEVVATLQAWHDSTRNATT